MLNIIQYILNFFNIGIIEYGLSIKEYDISKNIIIIAHNTNNFSKKFNFDDRVEVENSGAQEIYSVE